MSFYSSSRRLGRLFVGIDVHLRTWYVTVRTESEELLTRGIPGRWGALRGLLERYQGYEMVATYEAGFSGFWLRDKLVEFGINCIVTPPSLVPIEYGNRVKTDRKDSGKLAALLSKDLLKAVYVPSKEELSHRQVIRCRRQLVSDRCRTQHRIKSFFHCYGIEFSQGRGRWSRMYVENLWRINLNDRFMQESLNRLLEEYESLSQAIDKQNKLIKELSQMEKYRDRVRILTSIPGIGLLAAMEILLELQDLARFESGEQIAAYVGLTPSQYSSADKVRMGHITGIGKCHLRGVIVECSWIFSSKDPYMSEVYQRIKVRAGSKRAIVAVARRLLILAWKLILQNRPYTELVAA